MVRMNMNEDIALAVAATDRFVVVLRREDLEDWARKFDQIARALERGSLAEATHLYATKSYTGPGSLSDVYANDEPAFYAAWGACSNALRGIEQCL